ASACGLKRSRFSMTTGTPGGPERSACSCSAVGYCAIISSSFQVVSKTLLAPMASTEPLRMMGAVGSPYSRKLRAVLRYRRIPYQWIHLGSPESRGLPVPRVALLPQLFLPGPDGTLEARTDSSPLIRLLETAHAGRSVVPHDPV